MSHFTLHSKFLEHLKEAKITPDSPSFKIVATRSELFLNEKTLPNGGTDLYNVLDKYYELPKSIRKFTITSEEDSAVEIEYKCLLRGK